MKKRNLSILFLIGFVVLLVAGCGKEPTVTEFPRTFPQNNWERFNYITENLEIEDTAAVYKIELRLDYTEALQESKIPLVFIVDGPDGSSSCVHPMFKIETGKAGTQQVVVYDFKYFNAKGTYKLTYFHKLSNYDLYGIAGTTLIVTKGAK